MMLERKTSKLWGSSMLRLARQGLHSSTREFLPRLPTQPSEQMQSVTVHKFQ